MKVYVVIITEKDGQKGMDKLTSVFECYSTFEKAKQTIFDKIKPFAYCRKVKETDRKNVFEITDEQGKHIQTLAIVDLFVQ